MPFQIFALFIFPGQDHLQDVRYQWQQLSELVPLLEDSGSKITSLRSLPTSQPSQIKNLTHLYRSFVPRQPKEPQCIVKKLNSASKQRAVLRAIELPDTPDEAISESLQYFHLASVVYIGNAEVFDLFMRGSAAMYAWWSSVYWTEQVSTRTLKAL